MKKYGDSIGEGKACIVVRDQGLDKLDHEFWKWLHDEGFTMWHSHGHYKSIDWVFINLNSMVYAPGMPGIKIVTPIRELPGMTVEEFKTIWGIYKYREEHPVITVYEEKDDAGVSPVVPEGTHLCHIYEIEDAGAAGEDLETEPLKDYGPMTSYQGVLLHSNHESEGGGRSLVRCKKCGALLLSQHSWYEAMNPELDGSFYDWLPVWSEDEADLLNIFLNAGEFADCAFRHLRSNNHKYCWVGDDQPRPMDLPELSQAIALKYEDKLSSLSKPSADEND